MDIKQNHYTYKITNKENGVAYIGVRSDTHNKKPWGGKPDILTGNYATSSNNDEFTDILFAFPKKFTYEVIQMFDTRDEAMAHEVELHKEFDVGICKYGQNKGKFNTMFYNLVKQTSKKFDSTGLTAVFDEVGRTLHVPVDHPKLKSGKYVSISTGLVPVKDEDGKQFKVSTTDPRYISGELKPVNEGKVLVTMNDGTHTLLDKLDPRFLNGEFAYYWTGKKHREDTKKKIGEKSAINQMGSKNSQFGKKWYTDGIEDGKYKPGTEPSGWRNGRSLISSIHFTNKRYLKQQTSVGASI